MRRWGPAVAAVASVLALGCGDDRAVSEAAAVLRVSYDQCRDLTIKIHTCWVDRGVGDVYLCLRGIDRAATRAAHEFATERVPPLLVSVGGPQGEALRKLTGLERRMCRLALDPAGETLLTFSSTRSRVQDDRQALEPDLALIPPDTSGELVAAQRAAMAEARGAFEREARAKEQALAAQRESEARKAAEERRLHQKLVTRDARQASEEEVKRREALREAERLLKAGGPSQ